jgi:hypothetical protein
LVPEDRDDFKPAALLLAAAKLVLTAEEEVMIVGRNAPETEPREPAAAVDWR